MVSIVSGFRGNRGKVLLWVALILVGSLTLCFSILNSQWIGLSVPSTIIIAAAALRLIRITDRSHESFAQFLLNITHDDFSTTTVHNAGDISASKFAAAQRKVIEKFRKLKADRSAQHELLHMVVEHVDTALLCFDDAEQVTIVNRSAKELLNCKFINKLSRIDAVSKELGGILRSLEPGENKVLKVTINNERKQLFLSATKFRLIGNDHKLVSIKNINTALDEKEIESWEKLIKVLTHEIMNSMTPIVSLSRHMERIVRGVEKIDSGVVVEQDQYNDLFQGIESIASRSQGLLKFVDAYRSFNNLPKPNKTRVDISVVFGRVCNLLSRRLSAAGIVLNPKVAPLGLIIYADPIHLEQILINLIANSIDAVKYSEAPLVELHAIKDDNGRTVLIVRDNGCGISAQHIDDVFTPFFTTKPLGSGVGLSISRQLATLNGASLWVRSTPDRGSAFFLRFPI